MYFEIIPLAITLFQTRTQYKRTGHCRKYNDMLSWLHFSAISKHLILKNNRDFKKLFPVCEIEILQVTVIKIEVLSSFLGCFLTIFS